MDLLLALEFLGVVAGLAWVGAAIVLALILLTVRRDDSDDAVLRAAAEMVLLLRRGLRPAMLTTILSLDALAWAGGFAGEAWVDLATALALAAWTLARNSVEPACAGALQMPQGAAPSQARHALGLARTGLWLQLGALAVLMMAPGWSEAVILAGLGACLCLAIALGRGLGEGATQPT